MDDKTLSLPSNQYEDYGAYDKDGHVYAITSPKLKPDTIKEKEFPSPEEAEDFMNELTFMKYSFKGSFLAISRASDDVTDEELRAIRLQDNCSIEEAAKRKVIELVKIKKMYVFLTGEYIESKDRNHNQTPKGEIQHTVNVLDAGNRATPLTPPDDNDPVDKGKTNAEVRAWYKNQVESIDTNISPTKENAIKISEKRNKLKHQARDMMKDQKLRRWLDENRPIQDFDYYEKKYRAEGFEGDALWERIIKGSATSNKDVNKKLGV